MCVSLDDPPVNGIVWISTEIYSIFLILVEQNIN